MSYSIWLFLVALSGWAAGYIVGGRGFGVVADILFGFTGGMTVRFCIDAMSVRVTDVNLLLFSIWGAAALSGFVRLRVRRRHNSSPRNFTRVRRGPEVAEAPRSGSRADSHDSSRAA
jgi:uncharacterized membrane protein YeaQ/YmgE (transglycosylase-associated protein family)